MEVPLAASVPLPNAPIRTVDVMPTMLEALGLPIPEGLDGLPFSRLAPLGVAVLRASRPRWAHAGGHPGGAPASAQRGSPPSLSSIPPAPGPAGARSPAFFVVSPSCA